MPKRNFFNKISDYFKESNEDKTTEKKIDFSIIGGPHYSSDVKLGLGIVASGLYRIDKENLALKPSDVSIFSDVATSGFFMIGIGNNNIFKDDRHRLNLNAAFLSLPSDFWGIGYENAEHAARSEYRRIQNKVEVEFMHRIIPNTYIGMTADFNYIEGRKFTDIGYLEGQDKRYVSTGFGVSLSYDSRDFITAPSRGMHIRLDQKHYPGFFGNKKGFSKTDFIADFYRTVWEGGVLAYDFHGEFSSADTPWTMISQMGGGSRMRGYYKGHYRDRSLIETQVELRQKIRGRHGMAAWVGAGNVFPDFSNFNWSHTLPTYGLGYRWEFKKRVAVRLDYGIGKGQTGFIFNINEAF